jgi:hypothetical protein
MCLGLSVDKHDGVFGSTHAEVAGHEEFDRFIRSKRAELSVGSDPSSSVIFSVTASSRRCNQGDEL